MKALDTPIEAASYHDFAALGSLKGQARSQPNDQAALRAAAQQFEAMFVQEMMKSMREANNALKSDLLDSHAMETFQGMFDKEVSVQMAKRGGLGVADMLVQQMSKRSEAPALPQASQVQASIEDSNQALDALHDAQAAIAPPSTHEVLQWRQGGKGFPLKRAANALSLNKAEASAGFELQAKQAMRLPRGWADSAVPVTSAATESQAQNAPSAATSASPTDSASNTSSSTPSEMSRHE